MNRPSFAIYDASAGSGKTFTLVKEYLKIILVAERNDAYKNILAITFTNKAVGEMKKRIVDCLYAFSLDQQDQKTLNLLDILTIETGVPQEKLKEKATRILKNIIHNYASFDISTIDKFTHRILRSFAFDLELPTLFEVSLDTDDLLNEAVDEIIASAGTDEKLTQLLINYALEKTDDDKSWDISNDIFEMSKLLVNENHRKEIAQYKDKSISDFLTIKQKLVIATNTLKEECQKIATEGLSLIESHHIDHSSFNRGLIPKALIRFQNGEIAKYEGIHYLEEGKRYAKSKAQDQKDAIDNIAHSLAQSLNKINQLAEKYLLYQAFLKEIIPLSLLSTIGASLDQIQKEKNILSISEFNSILNKEIQNQPAPFIYERLGERYNHFFIDEFQDTSEMQWQNLIPLIDNALAGENHRGEKGTLMLVGDPKQSIYRWRGGKAEQFIALSKDENPFVTPDKVSVSLDTNYRSYDEVINFNNAFFKGIATEFNNPDYRELYEKRSSQKTTDKKGGYVSIDFVPYTSPKDLGDEDLNSKEHYLEETLKKINQAIENGFNYSDIAVLTQKNKNSIAIAQYLTENNIPILSSDSLLLYGSNEVKLLIDLLRFIHDRKDVLAKASFLRYIAHEIVKPIDEHVFVKEGLKQQSERAFEHWFKGYGFEISFVELRQKSLYQSLEDSIKTFIPSEKNHAYVQYFLDIILEFDIRKQASLGDFFTYWETKEEVFKIPSPEGNNAVQIMTVHKSKGLEFPVVIFPFVDESIYRNRSKMWLNSDDPTIGLENVLVGKSKNVTQYGDEAATLFETRNQEELLDTINVLYVAFTRAGEQLHILSSLKQNKDGFAPNYTSYFMGTFVQNQGLYSDEQTHYEWGNPKRVSSTKNTTQKQNPIITAPDTLFDRSKIKIAQKSALLWDTQKESAIEYGTILHEILAYINSHRDIETALEKAVLEGLITKEKRNSFAETIKSIVNHTQLEDYFNPKHKIFNERALLVPNGRTLKPDKLIFLENKKALLLDYKTGSPEKKHQEQLNTYADIVESMGYTVVQKVLVYIDKDVVIETV